MNLIAYYDSSEPDSIPHYDFRKSRFNSFFWEFCSDKEFLDFFKRHSGARVEFQQLDYSPAARSFMKAANMVLKFYREILPSREYKNLNFNIVMQIETITAKLALEIGIFTAFSRSELNDYSKHRKRIQKSTIAVQEPANARREIARDLFNKMTRTSKIPSKRAIAKNIQNQWPASPKGKAPSINTIICYLKQLNLVK